MRTSSKKDKKTTPPSFVNSRVFVVLGGFLVVIIFLFSGVWLYFNHQIYEPKEINSEPQKFIVDQGQSVKEVGLKLEREGIIRDNFFFLAYWKLKSLNFTEQNTEHHRTEINPTSSRESVSYQSPISEFTPNRARSGSGLSVSSIKAGDYSLSPSMAIPEIVTKLARGETKSAATRVTIPEGFNIYEIDKRLAKNGLIEKGELLQFASSNAIDPSCQFSDSFSCDLVIVPCSEAEPSSVSCSLVPSLEGWLFPDTYKYKKGASVEAIVKKMLNNFENKALNLTELNTEHYGTVLQDSATEFREVPRSPSAKFRDILTVASIVEKEVEDLEKKRLVAGVIYNRLQAGMKLDSCPSVIYAQMLNASDPYGFIETTRAHNPVSLMDTEIESEYNTYQNKGLPPTPVSNPGLEAIRAALNPAETDFMFYLSNPAGETLFSETYQEHLRKKREHLR